MYSPSIIDRRLHAARKAGLKFTRSERQRSITISSELELLRRDRRGKMIPGGNTSRPLTSQEQAFVDSEMVLSKNDFAYWFERYCNLELDPGVDDRSGIGPPVMAESQKRFVYLFGRREEECFEEKQKYGMTLGIKAYFHKVRQIMATATARGASLHRMIFWPGTRALAATLDAPRMTELFTRDKIIIDGLPFWMKPQVYPDVKDTEIGFPHPTSSRIAYQAENQTGGIGVGSQVDVSHLTEVALWAYPGRIRYSFVPSIPKAITTLHVQESTADGKGNYWHEVSEAARHRRRGYESWIYAFIPWYYNRLKYRSNPPANWIPEDHTLRHAELIERTSPEFLDGIHYRPSREQLYWWESTRAEHAHNGELATFLTNYPATPEQSFQSPNAGALPVELIERMEQRTKYPEKTFDMELAATA